MKLNKSYTSVDRQLGIIRDSELCLLFRARNKRHSFAVRRVMLWHAEGTNVDQMMLALSTYMGHAEIFYTYWYLTAVPELMALAGSKFEHFADLMGDGDE